MARLSRTRTRRRKAAQPKRESVSSLGDVNMQGRTEQQPFRVQLIFYDELKTVQAVPLNGVPDPLRDETAGGLLHGKDDVLSFISAIGIDSIVQTRQLRDLPNPAFELIFHMRPAGEIISVIEKRFDTRYEADIKILEGKPLTERDRAAVSDLDCIVLGSTRLRSTDGFHRMREWLEQRRKQHAEVK